MTQNALQHDASLDLRYNTAHDSTVTGGPELLPILDLHGGHTDGYITFASRSDDEFYPRVAIRARELETIFPEFRDQLFKDSYVSINAGYRLQRYGADGRSWGKPLHNSRNLRYLCACYADIDYYNLGLEFGTVVGQVINLQESGAIPPPSLMIRGNGLWLLWLLEDAKNHGRAQRAFPDRIELYSEVQRAIYRQLACIGADPQGTDAARYVRVPGSLHTSSEKHVSWVKLGNANGGFLYTLPQLATLFGVVPRRKRRASAVNDAGNCQGTPRPNRRKGYEALHAYRLADFRHLLIMRGGGFNKGCRERGAMIYAWILRCNRVSKEEAIVAVTQMVDSCRPPLPRSVVRGAIGTGYSKSMSRMRDQTISDWLNINPEEAKSLRQFPAATVHGQLTDTPLGCIQASNRLVKQKQRREAILEVIQTCGQVPPTREMARLLNASYSLTVGHVQVSMDYKELGLKTRWTHSRESLAEAQVCQKVLF